MGVNLRTGQQHAKTEIADGSVGKSMHSNDNKTIMKKYVHPLFKHFKMSTPTTKTAGNVRNVNQQSTQKESCRQQPSTTIKDPSRMQTIRRPPQFESLFSNTTVFSTTTHEKTWRMERRVPSKRLSPFALLSSRLCWVGPKDSATLRLHPASGAWIILPSSR